MRTDIWDVVGGVIDAVGVLMGVFCLLCGVLIVLLVIWSVRMMIRRLREAHGVAASWPRAEAVVTDVDSRPLLPGVEQTTAAVATYSFSHPDGTAFTGYDEGVALKRPVIGMRFTVAYNPADPRQSHPTAGIRGRIGMWAVLFLTVCLLLLCCAGLFFALGVSTLL